jgi:hypothetical protein
VKKICLIFCCLLAIPLIASHIVGGEFELLHVSGNTYRLNLILYFDKLNGSAGAKDASINANIFRKSDNKFLRTINLPLLKEEPVNYTQPACSNGEVVTSKITYTALIQLPDSEYNDAGGYYVSWERCCRNYSIVNIFSQVPPPAGSANGIFAGQTFYLQFPPVVKDGASFINSSPHLFPPLNDYAAINRPYYVDFAGVDDDGDSLVYSLDTPFSTHNLPSAFIPALPWPYPSVQWRPGYSLATITKGNPDMRITRQGLITLTPPSTEGLFVFAVKVEEYRNKQKIGESRRDFQLLVVDKPFTSPPQILGKKLTESSFTYDNIMDVSFSNTVADGDRCIEVRVSDNDSKNADENFTEKIKIRAIPLNFKSTSLAEILPAETTGTLINGSTKDFRICFPKCPYISPGAYQIGIIAMDDACSLPLLDTLKVNVTVEPPANTAPYFTTPVSTYELINEGDSKSWPFQIKDDDGNELILYQLPDGFLLNDYGMKFTVTDQQNGLINGKIEWDAACNKYDFSKRTSFQIKILVDDKDECNLKDLVVAEYNLSIKLPGNFDPIIDTDLTPDPMERVVDGIERKIFQSLSFKVTGTDADNDLIGVRMIPLDFKPADFGITFPKTVAKGFAQSTFTWNMSCAKFDLKKKDVFEVMFIAVDSTNKCRLRKVDTVNVKIKILPPDNAGPLITVRSLNPELTLNNNHLNVTLGQQIILSLEGTDADLLPQKDSVKLSLSRAKGDSKPEGYSFTDAKGLGLVASTFTWNPDCSIFENDIYENNYSFKFYLKDNRCITPKADSVEVKITLKDVNGSTGNFIPVNVFTPNGDGKNDYYAMEVQDEVTGAPINILPADNCTGHFEMIQIVNRWGNVVFQSNDRNFRWYGKDEAPGVYFYYIKFSDREYKGALSLRY